jgi:endonuclease-3
LVGTFCYEDAMKLAEKAAKIVEILNKLYPDPAIPLKHDDAFTLLVSVALSAQTTDKKVNEVTPALFAKAKTPQEMAKLSAKEIEHFIKTVGLAPTKAKNIKAMSEKLVAEHNSEVPKSLDALVALPGVGIKTASVVMSQAFGENAFPVDTHIHRLAHRWGLSDGTSATKTMTDLMRIFDASLWNRLHLQIIYFGREHCPALRHDLSTCAICSWAHEADASSPKPRASVRGARKKQKKAKPTRAKSSTKKTKKK